MDKVWYGWPQCFLQHAHECRGESKSDVNFILYNVHLRNKTLNLRIGMALFQKHLKPYKSQSSTGTTTTTLIYHIFEAKRFPPWYLRTLGPQVLNIFKKVLLWRFLKRHPHASPQKEAFRPWQIHLLLPSVGLGSRPRNTKCTAMDRMRPATKTEICGLSRSFSAFLISTETYGDHQIGSWEFVWLLVQAATLGGQ